MVTLRDNESGVAAYCQRSFSVLEDDLNELDRLIDLLNRTAVGFLDVVTCDVVVPIYTSTIYDASCENSTRAIFWLYMTAFFLAFFGFVVLTLRASYRVSREAPEGAKKSSDSSDEPDGSLYLSTVK